MTDEAKATETPEVTPEGSSENLAEVEPKDNALRSQLGRKVKLIEEKFSEVEQKLSGLEETLTTELDEKFNAILERLNPQEDTTETEYLDLNDPAQLERYLEQREQKKMMESSKYQEQYIKTIGKLADSDIHDEIVDEMMANYNVRYSNDPAADAERNYYKAKAAVLARKAVMPEVNLREDDAAGIGIGGGTKTKASPKKAVKLPPDAEELMNYLQRKGVEVEP